MTSSRDSLALAQNEFLRNSFFIFDDYSQDELADQKEVILYFYPKEVPLNKYVWLLPIDHYLFSIVCFSSSSSFFFFRRQLFLMGCSSAMVSFAKEFSKVPVQVVKMETYKFSVVILFCYFIFILSLFSFYYYLFEKKG
jgi:hypothetical protein